MSIFGGRHWAYSQYVQPWERTGGMSLLRRGGYGAVDAVWYVPWMTVPQYGPYIVVELLP